MSNILINFTCYLFVVFTLCIDEGNGSWKKKYTETLQEDIMKFKEIAEKIEDEIEDFYDEYAENWSKDKYLADEYEKPLQSANYYNLKSDMKIFNRTSMFFGNTTNNLTKVEIPSMLRNTYSEIPTPKNKVVKEIISTGKVNTSNLKWPKFEEILQDMGKKYDWKNDRWVKVKKKVLESNDKYRLTSHERHKFNYRTVKLNRSKSRRNVVIAVTAVR